MPVRIKGQELVLKIDSLQATVADKPILKGVSLHVLVGDSRKICGISLEGSVG